MKRDIVVNIRKNNPSISMAAIGREVGITRERVRQILQGEGLPTKRSKHLVIPKITTGYINGLKKCTLCKEFLSLTEFYKSKDYWDHLIPVCKTCCNKRSLRYYYRNKHKVYARNESHRLYPERQKCEVFGCQSLGERHHMDYRKPSQIIWLCQKHHREYHLQKT